MVIILMAFLLIGCEDVSTEPSDTGEITTVITDETTEESTVGTYVLEYPDGPTELSGEIGSSVVIPELLKDNYIFIGWTDGSEYYAGLTEFVEGTKTLTPEYLPIESVFEKVDVSMGQANLINYSGESNIVGVPTYWHDMLIVGFTSLNLDIKKLYLPIGIQNGYHALIASSGITDLMIHGEEPSFTYIESMGQTHLEEYIEDCTYYDGGSIDLDNLSPGLLNEGCQIKSILRRNDESAVFVPGMGTVYTFAVLLNSDTLFINTLFKRYFMPELKYLSIDQELGMDLFEWISRNQLSSLGRIDLSSEDTLMMEDNQLYFDHEGQEYLGYIFSNDDVLELNSDTVNIMSDYFFVVGDVQEVNLINYDDFESIEGIVYETLDNSDMKLIVYPNNNQEVSYTFPSEMKEIRQDVYNEHVETITINDYFRDISEIMTYHFPNIKTIHVPEGHPYFIEEDGVIYDHTKESIYFINASVEDLVVQDSVVKFRPFSPMYIYPSYGYQSIDSIHLSEGVQADFVTMSLPLFDYETLTVDENNPYIKVRDGILYNGDYSEILYIEDDITSLVIQDDVEDILFYFGYFESLESIHLNENIDMSVLHNLSHLSSLERITIDENNPYMMAKDNIIYSKDGTELLLLPANLDIDVLNIPEDVEMIDNDALNHNPHIQAYIVDEDNPYYQSVDGLIYEDEYRISIPWYNQIKFIPQNLQLSRYTMPDGVTNFDVSTNQLSDMLSRLETINIGPDYTFIYDYILRDNQWVGSADSLTQLLYLVDLINIDSESPYYDADYDIIKTIESNILLAFTGDKTSYEVPSYIEGISQFLFNPSLSLQNITLQSSIRQLPLSIFEVEDLETMTIKGNDVLEVEGMMDSEVINDVGPTYTYFFNSHDLIIYVDAAMVEDYQNHPFWYLYDIRPIE